jgi:hypothetical protein
MSTLRIFNVSDYIHAGAAPKSKNSFSKPPTYYAGVRELPDGSYSASRLPTGGISFSLNPIFERITAEDYEDETLVFCIDDHSTIKKQMYSDLLKDELGYKANRAKKLLDVSIQRDAIKDILSLVSHNVLFCEGYEADDIIASLVWMYKKSYDRIIIHTRDSDLYCLVDDNVSVDLVGAQGKHVTKNNFSTVISDKYGYPMPFNGMALEKLFHGDTSDNIPGIGETFSDKIRRAIPKEKYKFLTNVNILRTWVGKAVDYNPIVTGILDLVLPLQVPEETLQLYDEPIDFNKLCYLGNRVGNKYCKKNTWNEEMEDVKQILNYYTDEYYMKGGRCSG